MTTLPGWTNVCFQLLLITVLSANSVFARTCYCQTYQGSSCTSCNTGCYLNNTQCIQCPARCVSCADWNDCDSCTEGYFGTSCYSLCSNCKYNTCNKSDGQCTNGCSDLHYPNTGWPGCSKCHTRCRTCNTLTDCTNCTQGYFGPSCSLICHNCIGSTCNKDDGQCTYGCADKYYQPQGQKACYRCPSQCIRCHGDTDCTACNTGYHDRSCDSKCDPNCKYSACDINSGVCTNGCVDRYYQSGTSCLPNCPIDFCQTCRPDNQACSVCQDGYYLFNGECSPCKTACLNRTCDKKDGSCTEGCKDGFTGRYCIDQCYTNCIACEQYNKETCTLCKPGYHSQKCENECNTQCQEKGGVRQCAKTDGECTQGCANGYTGLTCSDECNPNCVSCDQYDQRSCVSCNPGYYGQACDEICSFKCGIVNNTLLCYKDTGECLANCISGYRGPTCDVPCEVGCQDGCDRDTGTCDRCKALYYGSSCEHMCNSTCYNPNNGSRVCDKQTGDCSLSCIKPMCETVEFNQSVGTASPVTTPVIIGVAIGFVACLVLCVTGIVVFVLVRRKRRNTSNDEQTNETLENNADNVYSVLNHADQERTADYTALHTLRGQPQEVQVISSPPTDGNNATYVNADGTTAEPEKDGYENVFL